MRMDLNSRAFPARLLAVIVIAAILMGCQGQVSVDLATEPSGDKSLRNVVADLLGVELAKSDGTTTTLEFRISRSIDLLELQNGNLLTLFTNENLPVGVYTGIRLLFGTNASSNFVTDNIARRFSLLLTTGDYAAMDYTVEDEKSSHESLTLTLDLRQSLSFDTTTGDYTLRPYLRSVSAADASTLAGTVDINCASGTSLLQGGAVYLFQGQDVVPDDRDGSGVEPYATASLSFSSLLGEFTYQLLDLPAGDYTLAATCNGDQEDPTVDTLLDFRGTRNVQVARDKVITLDIQD